MSWFDKLFGEDNDSNDDLLRKNKKRRQGTQSQQNNQDSLLPQNNDIYNRPRGKFRFPMHVSEEASYNDLDNDKNYETSEYNANYGSRTYDTQDDDSTRNLVDNSGKRHRRRRSSQMREHEHINQHSNRNENQMHHRESSRSKRSSNNSQSDDYRSYNNKSNSRMKLQSERLKSNSKLQSSTNSELTYHGGSFKASDVPSAIFGTKQRRPLENGVIPPKQDSLQNSNNATSKSQRNQPKNAHDVNMYRQSINKQMGYQSEESSSKDNQPQPENHAKTSDTEQTQKTSSSHLQSNNHSAQKSEGRTPNYSKKDNTVNIENIYASQIVEEIRRERERKVLQKRRFKKALQQKRQQNKDNEEDQIQKAIDEMYAKQAHQYIGESSLDEDHNDEDMNDGQSNNVSESTTITSFKEDQIGASSYNYEEINLDDEQHIQKVNDEDVHVSDASSDNATEETSVDKAHNDNVEDAQFQELNDSQQSSESTSYLENENSQQQEHYNNAINQSVDNEKAYAKHRQKNDDDFKESASSLSTSEINSDSSSTIVNASNNDTMASTVDSKQSMTANEGQSFGNNESVEEHDYHSKMNSEGAESTNHYTNSEQHSELDSNQFMNNTNSNNSTSTSEVNSQSDSNVAQESELNRPTTQSQSKDVSTHKPRFAGGKPFNVVMTPSDKKRMMDSKNNSRVNVPELKPEQHNVQSTKEDSSEHQFSSESNLNESETNQQTSHEYQTQSESNDDGITGVSTSDNVNNNHIQQHTQSTSHNETSGRSSGNHFSETVKDNDDTNLNNNKTSATGITHQEVKEQASNSYKNQQESPQDKQQGIRKGPNIKLPSFDLLEEPEPHEVDEEWIEEKKQELNDALYYFNVPAEVKNVTEGPSVTRFELSVEKGVKVSRITALQDDIKMALAAKDIRIEAPIPGTSLVGIEVPNQDPTKVNLRSIIETPKFKNTESKLTVAMGYRINNEPLLMDIAKTPHALIAGATGSGKSVCINSILMSLLYKNHPEELRLLLIDPKMVELAPYNDLPHLVSPVITDVKAATQSLKWAVEEMEKRYKLFAQYHVRNITAFNKKAPYEQRMPKIVIVIDELADLMMMAPQEVEQSIARIAQKARACGIHMLVATQRPSVNVITGLIKANIPTRIAFMVSSSVDSRTILDSGGAERLLGYGDMLYLGSGMNKPIRVQGTFVSDEEIDDVVDFIKQQREPEYLFEEKELLKKTQSQAQDDLFDDVCEFMVNEGHISTSLIQRHFQIGYNRAARIIDQLEQLGYISGANGSKPRDVYITEADLNKE